MKAMILAAGLGKRMRPLTDTLPKPLLSVAGKPLIEHHLEQLKQAGVTQVVINVAYLGHLIKQQLGDGSRFGLSIQYSEESEPLETAGAIHQALPLLGHEPFLLINADVWTDFPIEQLMATELPKDCLAHLIFVANPKHHAQGDFAISSGRVMKFSDGLQGVTFSGVSLVDPRLITTYPHVRERFALREVFDRAADQLSMAGEVYTGEWWDIGTPERLRQLNERISHTETLRNSQLSKN